MLLLDLINHENLKSRAQQQQLTVYLHVEKMWKKCKLSTRKIFGEYSLCYLSQCTLGNFESKRWKNIFIFVYLGPNHLLLWWQMTEFSHLAGALMEYFLEGVTPLRHWYINPKWEEQIQIFSSELTYQILNCALPSRKCSIKAPAKCKPPIYVMTVKFTRCQCPKYENGF